jgi:hypothetical protein
MLVPLIRKYRPNGAVTVMRGLGTPGGLAIGGHSCPMVAPMAAIELDCVDRTLVPGATTSGFTRKRAGFAGFGTRPRVLNIAMSLALSERVNGAGEFAAIWTALAASVP